MSTVYRLLRRPYAKTLFDGEGAFRYGGRWSSPGTRVAYTAEHLSLAMIEYFVHIPMSDPPPDLVVAAAVVPDDLKRIRVTAADLPSGWRRSPAPAALARFGDEFVAAGRAAVLVVPSALAPDECNLLLNPRHADFARIRPFRPKPFAFDPRFLRSTKSK